MDESNNNVSYVIGVCNKLGTSAPSDCQGKDAVCWNGQELDVTSRTFYYEGEHGGAISWGNNKNGLWANVCQKCVNTLFLLRRKYGEIK